jgi:hypothetical protein
MTMKKLTCLLFYSAITGCLFAQQNTVIDSSLTSDVATYARQVFDSRRGNELPLFNGIRHQLYSPSVEGLPYFQSLNWYTGSVVYDDILYQNIIMRFDQVKDELVVAQGKMSAIYISLFSPRVKEFSFEGMSFIRLNDTTRQSSLQSGFYQQLVKGKATALFRNAKSIDEKIEGTTLLHVVRDHTRYYIMKDDKYYWIRSTSDLLDALKDHRREVQQFISESRLKFRREPNQTIIAATEFYNKL